MASSGHGRSMLYLSGVIRPDLPALVTPRMRQRPAGVWAADTGCFADPAAHDDLRYLAWLERMPLRWCLFATAPDRLGDMAMTLLMSLPMLPRIRALGVRAALVAQDGAENVALPWAAFDCLFLGGSTAWKLSEPARALGLEAVERGKWLHMGRVNSRGRYRQAISMGAHSVDGTLLRYGPESNRGRIVAWEADAALRLSLWQKR